MIRIANIKVPLDYNDKKLLRIAEEKLNLRGGVKSVSISKKSVDARDKGNVHFVLSLDAEVSGNEEKVLSHVPSSIQASIPKPEKEFIVPQTHFDKRPVVVGLGPAGLFAAYTLAMAGASPIVLERGQNVDDRARTIQTFKCGGGLNPDCNVQFGEGGAGAFSDGKLNSGINDERCRLVLRTLYECGAPEEILYLAKPHIGTDRLPKAVKNLRERIVRLGGEVLFETKLTKIIKEDGRLCGVEAVRSDGTVISIATDTVILAVGHSARDTFEMLYSLGISMIRKPFSIGARIEHSQKLISRSQYGEAWKKLPAADYKLNTKASDGRGVYTFCMCPGGTVVAAASEIGGVVTNGMSVFARDGDNANSALLVSINPEDFGGDDPLAGVRLQRKWEMRAFEVGGGDYSAPAQLVGDFLSGRPSTHEGDVEPTYKPKVTYTDLSLCLPGFVVDDMREAIQKLDRQLHGFAGYGAVLTGVETRSSSPLRILRNEECQSSLKGLFPCGEGAGYAGGILSADVDGIRCAEKAIAQFLN